MEERRFANGVKMASEWARICRQGYNEGTFKLVHRSPHKEDDPFIPFMIKNDELHERGHSRDSRIVSLSPSGRLQFILEPSCPRNKEKWNAIGQVRYDFASELQAESNRASEDFSEFASDLSLAVFRARTEVAFHSWRKGDDFVDVVMASPSLEVGVDLPNLTESVMTRAVRNLASYRQKAGRVGRESMSEALNLTLATDSANDLHYYRQPRKLIDRGRLEPVPLKERNDAVAKSTAYLCVWDILVSKNFVPEALKSHSTTDCLELFTSAKEFIEDGANRSEIHEYIASVLNDERYPAGTDWFDDAISQVLSELNLFLKPISGYEFQPPLRDGASVIEGMRHLLGSKNPNSARPQGGADSLIEDYEEGLEQCNSQRSKAGFLRDDYSELLDRTDRILRGDELNIDEIDELSDSFSDLKISFNDDSRESYADYRILLAMSRIMLKILRHQVSIYHRSERLNNIKIR